mmetsp:Transcript_70423/g.184622  ORF Transcript_70423/g.184622 Transcript_70423/m.184622 type:complete len:206 (+) Transcript_70423:433-1050(+)
MPPRPGAVDAPCDIANCGGRPAPMPAPQCWPIRPSGSSPSPAFSCCWTCVRRCMSASMCCSFATSRCMTLSTCMSCACTCSSSGFGAQSDIRLWTWSIASLWCFRRSALWLCAWIVCQSSCFKVPTSPSQASSSFAMLFWRSAFRSPWLPGSRRAVRSVTILIFSLICSILALTLWISWPTLASLACLASRIMISTCWPISLAMS